MLDQLIHALWIGAAGLTMVMAATFFCARALNNYGIVDAVWAFSFLPLTVWFAWSLPGHGPRDPLLVTLVALWSVRLGVHLTRRIAREHPHEDQRYAALRQHWAPRAELKMFNFYQLQAIFTLLLATPLLLAATNPAPALGAAELIGAMIVCVGWLGESVADAQLRRFKRERAAHETVCQRGLWRHSRHPNYFFEWTVWVGFAVFALGAPWGWLGLISPVIMLHLLLNVTGVPATERAALASKGDAYREYQRTTNAFLPGPRRPLPDA